MPSKADGVKRHRACLNPLQFAVDPLVRIADGRLPRRTMTIPPLLRPEPRIHRFRKTPRALRRKSLFAQIRLDCRLAAGVAIR